MAQVFAPGEIAAEPAQGLGREVEPEIALTSSGHASQQQPGPATDLQHARRPQTAHLPDRLLDPDLHLLSRDRFPGVAAVPAYDVEIAGRLRILTVGRLIDLLPRRDLRCAPLFRLRLPIDDITQELLLTRLLAYQNQ